MTVKAKILNIILSFALVLSVLVRNFDFIFPKHFYYISESILIFVVSLYLYSYVKNFFTFLLFGLTINNLFDELFFNPLELGINEIVVTIVLILIAIFRYVRRKSQLFGPGI